MQANLYNWGVLQAAASILHAVHPAWFTTCTVSCSFLRGARQFQIEAPAHYWKREKSGEEVNAYTGRYHLLQSGGCWYAAGTPNSPFFHILLISPIFLPTLHFSEPFCHSCSTLPLYFPPQTRGLQWSSSFAPCPWAFLVPHSSKAISHSGIKWTKSLEASDRGPLAAWVTDSRTF